MSLRYDKELGLDRQITRRDFVYCSSLFVSSMLAGCGKVDPQALSPQRAHRFNVGSDWYGPGGVGDYASSHGNTPELLQTARSEEHNV